VTQAQEQDMPPGEQRDPLVAERLQAELERLADERIAYTCS
jgi:hypothetical protein